MTQKRHDKTNELTANQNKVYGQTDKCSGWKL